jgi:hypothetical protein
LYFAAEFTGIGNEFYRLGRSSVGLETQELVSFKAYPNPANDKLTITTEKNTAFTLLDMTGKVLRSFSVDQQKEISILDLSSGIYILRENNTGAQRKVIKK